MTYVWEDTFVERPVHVQTSGGECQPLVVVRGCHAHLPSGGWDLGPSHLFVLVLRPPKRRGKEWNELLEDRPDEIVGECPVLEGAKETGSHSCRTPLEYGF